MSAYGVALSLVAGASAAYERPDVSDSEQAWLRQLRYQPTAECPAPEWLANELSQLLGDPTEGTSELVWYVASSDEYTVGELSAPRLGWHKHLRAAACKDVIRGLTISLAVHLDTLPLEEPSDVTSDEELSTEHPQVADSVAKIESPTPPDAMLTPVGPVPPPESALEYPVFDFGPGREPEPESPWKLVPFLGVETRTSVAPDSRIAARVGAWMSHRSPVWGESYFGLQLAYQPPTSTTRLGEVSVAEVEYGYWAAGAHICPPLFAWGEHLQFGPCMATHVGVLSAVQVGEAGGGQDVFALGELNAMLLGRWGAAVTQLQLGAHWPISPISLKVDRETVFRQDTGVSAALALGWQM